MLASSMSTRQAPVDGLRGRVLRKLRITPSSLEDLRAHAHAPGRAAPLTTSARERLARVGGNPGHPLLPRTLQTAGVLDAAEARWLDSFLHDPPDPPDARMRAHLGFLRWWAAREAARDENRQEPAAGVYVARESS
jgi:hypothetical protein